MWCLYIEQKFQNESKYIHITYGLLYLLILMHHNFFFMP